MGTIASAFNTAFRDYNTDGVAASGAKQPAKSDLRALGGTIEAYFAAPWTLSANVTVTILPTAPAGYVQQLIGSAANADPATKVRERTLDTKVASANVTRLTLCLHCNPADGTL